MRGRRGVWITGGGGDIVVGEWGFNWQSSGLSSMGLDGGGALVCLHQMRRSMMINFSPANQRAGNAGLGKLGPRLSYVSSFGGDDVPWSGSRASRGKRGKVHAVTKHAQSSGSTRHTIWPGCG